MIWSESDGSPTLRDLAERVAPVLWFSPDEPLLNDFKQLPESLPYDGPSPKVYYRVVETRVRGNSSSFKACLTSPACRLPFPMSGHNGPRWEKILIRFLFYFSQDVGFGGHPHDLESIDVMLQWDTLVRPARQVIRATSLAGAAHGVGWYTNELRIGRDDSVVLPIRILIEEGKHAAAPDRNADGYYNPGYDVNVFTNDAWGIRDTMVGRYLPGSSFQAHMFKPRQRAQQMWPPQSGMEPSYSLVHTLESAICGSQHEGFTRYLNRLRAEGPATEFHVHRLEQLLAEKAFCAPPDSMDGTLGLALKSSVGGAIQRPYLRTIERVSLSYRSDGGQHGLSFSLPYVRVPGVDGWLVARTSKHALRNSALPGELIASFDVLYTRSASKIIDWYVAAGADYRAADHIFAGNVNVVPTVFKGAVEGGVKVRFPSLVPFFPFVGFRVGIRTDEFAVIKNPRGIFEIGLGAW